MNGIIDIHLIFEKFILLGKQAIAIWISGDWAMYPIAVTAFVMFALGINVHIKLSGKGFTRISEKKWRKWIDHPEMRKGHIGRILDFVTGGKSIEDTKVFFEELYAGEIAPFERDLKVMKICVSAAPLLGLLGTVTGMLATFGALASGSGGDKTMEEIAKGISAALVTTETGLVIALPGLFFHYQMVRKHERYKAFLAHLETVCTQKQYKKIQAKKAG